MDTSKVTVEARLPWWARYYIASCSLFAVLTGATPDTDKIVRTVMRHARWRIVPKD